MFVETLRRLWFLFLAFFRSKPEKRMSKTVLPLSSNKARLVGKPELLSPPHQRDPTQRRGSGLTSTCGRLAGSHHQISPHPNSYPRSNPQDLPSDGLPSNGHPHSYQGFSPYSLILPPPRPPRPRSISVSVSEDEFGTPVISDDRLPSVIVTPCTPSTKAGRKYIGTNGLDESNSDGESSGSDANSLCITSVDSNPFLSDPSPTLQKEFYLPPLGPRTLNYHHRARSLTGTGRGLRHQRLSRSETSIRDHPLSFSPQPRVAKTGTSTNPVEKSESPLLIKAAVAPSVNKTSFIRSRPNVVWDSASQAIADQRIRSYMTSISSERSTDQTLFQDFTLDPTSASTRRHSEDPTARATASCVAQPALLASTVMDQLSLPSSLTPSVHGHALLGLVSYTEVFDLDAYFDSDPTLPTESTLKSSLKSSCSTISSNEFRNPFLSPTTPSPNCSSSAIVIPPPNPIRRTSDISDTTASSTSIYTYSLSHTSTDTDESTSSTSASSSNNNNNNPRRFGFIRITDNGRKSKLTFDHEVKRYRDHYRPPAYSRSPAFVIESPTTSRKFIGKRESDSGMSISDRANKENKMTFSNVSSIISTPTRAHTKLANPISLPSPSCPSHVHANAPGPGTDMVHTGTRRAPALLVRANRQESPLPFRNQQTSHTPDSSKTVVSSSVSESPAGKNVATRHRLGSLAITQRRRM